MTKAVASSREDAWIETSSRQTKRQKSRSRPPARTRGLKPSSKTKRLELQVASSREDAWIETADRVPPDGMQRRVLPRGRVD